MFKSFKYKRISGGYVGKEGIDPGNSNNISILSWRSVLLVKETRVPEENHRPAASHR